MHDVESRVEANTTSYNTVIKACAEAHNVARAERFMPMMLKAGVEANTISYNTVIKTCAETRDEHWMSMMLKAGVEANIISYTTDQGMC